jgi:hypothetical protein
MTEQFSFTRTRSTASFTRPNDTTAYASGDLVANSTTAGSVTPLTFTNIARPMHGSGLIRSCSIRKTGTSTTNASFRVHFFSASPTVSNGDNGALTGNLFATYLGGCDVTIDRAFADGSFGKGLPVIGTEVEFELGKGNTTLYALLEARAAYTPTAQEVFTVTPRIFMD